MSKVHEIITSRFIEALENGVIPWRKPWNAASSPCNYMTEKPYQGVNVLLLNCISASTPYFLTFKQIQGLGGNLKQGSKSIPICYYTSFDTEKKDAKGNAKKAFFLKYYRVFRWEDTEGIPAKGENEEPRTIAPIDAAQAIWEGYQNAPRLAHGGGRAFYRPSEDHIQMPERDTFETAEGYYGTLFHEMAHSTGAVTRLNRPEIVNLQHFGSVSYSREELVAEIGASFLGAECGIFNDSLFENSAAYIGSWIKALKDDSSMVLWASAKAAQAAAHILGKTKVQEESEEGA